MVTAAFAAGSTPPPATEDTGDQSLDHEILAFIKVLPAKPRILSLSRSFASEEKKWQFFFKTK